jgi:2'-5' RNA ligase
MIRAFLAVELADPLKAALATIQSDLKRRVLHELPRNVSLSWVRPAALHLTVRFLGDIDETLVDRLQHVVSETVSRQRPLRIPLERLGVFPRIQQPRVLWIGPSDRWETSDDAARLTAVHQSIEESCRALDLAPETKPLSAHLTLARIKVGHHAVGQALAKSGVMDRASGTDALPVDAIALMRSQLNPSGSVYTKLWEARFEAAQL